MARPNLLEGEELERTLKPHPFSFGHLFALPVALLLSAGLLWWLYRSPQWVQVTQLPFVGDVGTPAAYVVWWGLLLGIAAAASVKLISWRNFFLVLAGLIGGTVLVAGLGGWRLPPEPITFIPFWTLVMGAVGMFMVEVHRQSHRYHITNYRILSTGGIATRNERSLRYANITDLHGQQTAAGKLLGYGTVIPVTESGFGLGSDLSFAGLGLGAKAGGGTKGASGGVGGGVAAGGGKDVQTARGRTYDVLHGVWPYNRVKHAIEEHIQANQEVPHMQDQTETLKRIERHLAGDEEPGDDA